MLSRISSLRIVNRIRGLKNRTAQRVRGMVGALLRRSGLVTRGELAQVHQMLAQIEQQDSVALPGAPQQSSTTVVDELNRTEQRLNDLLRWLAEEPWSQPVAATSEGPLVSVLMPARDRAECIARAIGSVQAQTYKNWELIIVDDGSRDGTFEVAESFAQADPRIRCFRTHALGVCSARNRAFRESQGELIAYLDSDNRMTSDYLARVAQAMTTSSHRSVYFGQVLLGPDNQAVDGVRFNHFDKQRLEQDNYIDLNVFAHRRDLFEEVGGFDESLTRVVDWDLILRMSDIEPPQALPAIGGFYHTDQPQRVTKNEFQCKNIYQVRRKRIAPIPPGLRVLYAVWHYPQVTETYIRWEIESMRNRGVEVAIFRDEREVAMPHETDLLIYDGDLSSAIEQFRPDLMHVHWVNQAVKFAPIAELHRLPMTVRGHGFEFHPDLIQRLQESPAVRGIFLHPHQAEQVKAHSKVTVNRIGVHDPLYYPEPKNRRLVFRTGAGLPTKDYELYIDLAAACPEFDFVLAPAPAVRMQAYLDQLLDYNRQKGSPVKVVVGRQTEEVAQWMRSAGIYLHTMGPQSVVGAPISIVEAMASGCYLLARNLDSLRSHVGEAGDFYSNREEAAALLRKTLFWSEADWKAAEMRSVDRAYREHNDLDTFGAILDDWLKITGHGQQANADRRAA